MGAFILTEQQKLDRKLGVGGSDIPIILGLSQYKTPYQLWAEKSGLIINDFEMTPPQFWGHRLEPIIREEFAERNNVTIETPDTLLHPNYEFLRANVDGFIPEWNAVLEIKCSRSTKEWGDIGSDIIPLAYLLQVAHYVATTDADSAHIAVLIAGSDYREFKYIRDLDVERKVVEAAKLFWYSVQNGVPPELKTEEDIKIMFPTHAPGKKIIINDKIVPSLVGYMDAQKQTKELAANIKELKFEIIQYMQDSECLVDADGIPLATYKASKRGVRSLLIK